MNNKYPYLKLQKQGSEELEDYFDDNSLYYFFPKLDGSQGTVWCENDELMVASRNRLLSSKSDNAGFHKYIQENKEKYLAFFKDHPNYVLYGEWLVKHTINYEENLYNKFYIFDVFDTKTNQYINLAEKQYQYSALNFIQPFAIHNGKDAKVFIEDYKNESSLWSYGTAIENEGEGFVVKKYNHINKFGRKVYLKVLSDNFKSKKQKPKANSSITFPARNNDLIEAEIIDKYMDDHFIQKEKAKLLENGKPLNIPQFLNTTWYTFIAEETNNFIKKNNYPVINFRILKIIAFEKLRGYI